MKPTQYILVGYPFAGKSTLAKALVTLRGFAHVSLDQVKTAQGFGALSDDDVTVKAWERIFAIADAELIKQLKAGKHVAHATAWTTREWRDRARNIAAKQGFPTKLIWISTPENVVRKRWEANKKTKARYDTPVTVFEEAIAEFEKPSPDEDVLTYDQTMPVAEWIAQTFPLQEALGNPAQQNENKQNSENNGKHQ